MTSQFSLEFKDSQSNQIFKGIFTLNNTTKLVTSMYLDGDQKQSDILLPISGTQYQTYNGGQFTGANNNYMPYSGFDNYNVGFNMANQYYGGASVDNAFDLANGWTMFDQYGIQINVSSIPYFLTNYPNNYFGPVNIYSPNPNGGGETGSAAKMTFRLYSNGSNYSMTDLTGISVTFVNLSNNNNNNNNNNVNPCFYERTRILCLNEEQNKDEYVVINSLKAGDLVKTYKNGYKKVNMIGKNSMVNDSTCNFSSNCMYILKKEKIPGMTDDLMITGNHSILVDKLSEREQYIQNLFWKNEQIEDKQLVLSAASDMFEQIKNNTKFTYYHFVLENDDKDAKYGVYANGVLCETISENEFNRHTFLSV